MLVGLGIDVVDVRGFARQLADEASSFAAATFTEAELAYSRAAVSREPARHLAVRYAAKEAALKALDQASATAGVSSPAPALPLRDIEVARDAAGRPGLRLHGAALALAERIGADRALVSLTHDGDFAAAVVTLERL